MCLASDESDEARLRVFIHSHSVDTLADIGPINIETISFQRNNKIIHLEPSEEILLRYQDVSTVSEELKIIRTKQNPDVTHKIPKAMTNAQAARSDENLLGNESSNVKDVQSEFSPPQTGKPESI